MLPKNADIAIVVIGEAGYRTDGEGRDVASLDLTGLQEELLKEVYASGTPTIVVLINGRPLSIAGHQKKSRPLLRHGCAENREAMQWPMFFLVIIIQAADFQ